jgi:hypothetical protein
MHSPPVWLIATLVLAAGSLPAQESRAPDPHRLAILDRAEAGPDFADQGEYAGHLFLRHGGGWASQPFGLQVAAQGDGQFIGTLYRGGLPGAGWDRSQRWTLAGARTAAGVELHADGTYVTVSSGGAKLASSSRQWVGELRRLERSSPTLGLHPPAGAVVLFDGRDTSRLRKARVTPQGLLCEGAEFDTPCRDFSMHLEFLLPFMPQARGQGRANSGVYVQSRYEIQVLDSFALEGIENECGALYRQRRPDINMCSPPLMWQTYDLDFTSPRFDAQGAKLQNARLTVRHNGTLIHNNVEVISKTGAGAAEGAKLLPTKLQDHGNPVRFRNIWLVDRARVTQLVDASPSVPSSRHAIPSAPPTRYFIPRTATRWESPARAYTWPSGAASPQMYPGGGSPSSAPFHPGLYAPHYRDFGQQNGIPSYGSPFGYW